MNKITEARARGYTISCNQIQVTCGNRYKCMNFFRDFELLG